MENTRVATTSERLKEALRISGKKQVDLVRETGLDKGSISAYISGKYEPKASSINKLAIALGVSEMWLWGYNVSCERTSSQKNNDDLIEVISKMRTCEGFRKLATNLAKYNLSDEQYRNIENLVISLVDQ